MKNLNSHSLFGWVTSLAKATVVIAGLAFITGCASSGGFFRNADSPLPIKTLDATGGQIASTRAFETSDRLYVAGSMRRSSGHQPPLAAHVDIQLVDEGGRILAEKQDDIDSSGHPRTASGRSRASSYVASFPLDLARQAGSIRVSYHLAQHADSPATEEVP